MPLKIHMLTLGVLETNCYIVGDMDTKEAVVIDPADNAPTILSVIERENWTVKKILATHSHFDHVLAVGDLKTATGATFRLHRADLDQLRAAPQMTQMFIGESVPLPPEPDSFVEEGDVINVGGIMLRVLFTPGHSVGHVSYVLHNDVDRVVFSGDCLFLGSIGRTDLPGGDYDTLMTSIVDKLLPLGDEFTVAAGHMQTTTIGRERMSNPFIFDWMTAHGD
jgi:glyoxylase-like metal-dependent hydrolase (beta-lactamase superfamily II)